MPSSALTIYGIGKAGNLGISLRGSFQRANHGQQLVHAIRQLLTAGGAPVWIDCRFLAPLTWQGQRAILQADQVAREMGGTLFWCGFPAALEIQLQESGLLTLLNTVPATHYEGPRTLLLESVPRADLTLLVTGA